MPRERRAIQLQSCWLPSDFVIRILPSLLNGSTESAWFFESSLVSTEHRRPNPAGVVFGDPGFVQRGGAWLVAVGLVIHAAKRQRLDLPTLSDVKIGVFVPADDM